MRAGASAGTSLGAQGRKNLYLLLAAFFIVVQLVWVGLPIVMTMVDAHLDLDPHQFTNPVLAFDRLILRSDWMKGNTL